MAHYAILNQDNIVIEVITGVDEDVVQYDFDGSEVGGSSEAWEAFYGALRGMKCKRTSLHGNIRKNFAGIGYTYDEERDAFIPRQPYSSWTLDEETCQWVSPVPYPNDGKFYLWDEKIKDWYEPLD